MDPPTSVLDVGSRGYGSDFAGMTNAVYTVRSEVLSTASAALPVSLISLYRVRNLAAEPNWDGYSARPISQETVSTVQAFLGKLPGWVPSPDVVPEPDGEIAMEWTSPAGDLLSVSLGEAKVLNYAGLFSGGVERHGVEPFAGNISEDLLGQITRVVTTTP
jgi:hypothetical protein